MVRKYLLLPDRAGESGGGKERIYLCGNKPFPTRLMAFDITSMKDLLEKCCSVTMPLTEMFLCDVGVKKVIVVLINVKVNSRA